MANDTNREGPSLPEKMTEAIVKSATYSHNESPPLRDSFPKRRSPRALLATMRVAAQLAPAILGVGRGASQPCGRAGVVQTSNMRPAARCLWAQEWQLDGSHCAGMLVVPAVLSVTPVGAPRVPQIQAMSPLVSVPTLR
jgi:hypothetical protein